MPQKLTVTKLLQQLSDQNIQKVKLAVTDLDGVLRGKVISFEKFKSIAMPPLAAGARVPRMPRQW